MRLAPRPACSRRSTPFPPVMGSFGLRGQRQSQDECAPLAKGRRRGDVSAVHANVLPAQVESEADAPDMAVAGGDGTAEPREEVGHLLLTHADPFVAYPEPRQPLPRPQV